LSQALQVVKRDGRVVPFDRSRISEAIRKSLDEAYGPPDDHPGIAVDTAAEIERGVIFDADIGIYEGGKISVEEIQDLVELKLMQHYPEAAKRYILYRAEHARAREERPIPADVRAAFEADRRYFPTPLQAFQFYDKYSRFNRDLGRRETWVETVDRTVDFLHELSGGRLPRPTYERIRHGILNMEVMPSMRLLAMAGDPARRDNTAIYNCSYQPVDSLEAFSEALLISMAGCGVGYSVESKYVDQLPPVSAVMLRGGGVHIIEDSAEGWAKALLRGLDCWFRGIDITFAYDAIRPAGAVLKTKGGRASGPEPLRRMLELCRDRIRARAGKKLRPIDAHDLMCAVGSAAVSGGVRRTAMIALFDEDDPEMLHCKSGDFERDNSQRWNANNSAVWTNAATMDQATFIDRFMEMVRSGRGEPGIFNREAAQRLIPTRRTSTEFGTNPCGEIILRPWQFCNLSAAIVRADDTIETMREKVALASVIGTIQSAATHFPNLRPIWRQNCEEERLLGVDITGQMDNPLLLTPAVFEDLRRIAVTTNIMAAALLGINPSKAVTCVKPSGNTSQLVDCASGLHARWAPYYIRNVRVAASSPIARVLKDAGVPMSPENGDDPEDPRTWVASFPVRAPSGAVTRQDRGAVEQCEWWLRNKRHWTEHNPSVTITYRPDEVLDLMTWVWEHRNEIGGMAFLPAFDAKYDQLPYIEIGVAEYERRVAAFPKEIDWARIFRYEASDMSTASTTMACEGPVCLVDS
jgi:ribonucleoside-triphosphate reductase